MVLNPKLLIEDDQEMLSISLQSTPSPLVIYYYVSVIRLKFLPTTYVLMYCNPRVNSLPLINPIEARGGYSLETVGSSKFNIFDV